VTRTFSSTIPFTIASDGSAETVATPYPSTIAVSGFDNGVITDVNLVLADLTHPYPDDLDLLLSASDGRRAFVMSDVGSNHPVTNLDLLLDDETAVALPDDAALSSGTFRPAIFGIGSDVNEIFPAPAPAHSNIVALSTFDGADPNGTWHLWVVDDSSSDIGDMEGWALQITAEVDVQVQEQVRAKAKHKTPKKKGKSRH
jgi:subtilisin-like proprotein convertase family protein